MKFNLLSCFAVGSIISLLSATAHGQISTGVGGEGVTVGDSDLIETLQYSDTFTVGSGTSGNTRDGSPYTLGSTTYSSGQLALEHSYGNSSQSWVDDFSLNNDADHYSTSSVSPYPGSSGAGSNSGMTQTGLNSSGSDFGFKYNSISSNFVVQVDAVQTNDYFLINIGNTNSTANSTDGLAVVFDSSSVLGGVIGLYNVGVGTTNTTFDNTAVTNTWNNYAVDFNLSADTLSVYTNETLLGTINLTTFDGGAYAKVLNANSSEYVDVGAKVTGLTGSNIGILWTDNFEVGTVPEPATPALLLGGLALLAGMVRLRRVTA